MSLSSACHCIFCVSSRCDPCDPPPLDLLRYIIFNTCLTLIAWFVDKNIFLRTHVCHALSAARYRPDGLMLRPQPPPGGKAVTASSTMPRFSSTYSLTLESNNAKATAYVHRVTRLQHPEMCCPQERVGGRLL